MRIDSSLPIGIFDSGVGGLTVLSALRNAFPTESFIYLGDTARLPYGTKSKSTVSHYAHKCLEVLVQKGIKAGVIACNTASSVALDGLRRTYPNLPLFGVIEPGVQAVVESTSHLNNPRVLVLATESTTRWHAYNNQLSSVCPNMEIVEFGCPLFVPLAEEGWTDGPLVQQILSKVLEPVLGSHFDCVLLGCTHFPMLQTAIQHCFPSSQVINSADVVAKSLVQAFDKQPELKGQGPANVQFMATDSIERFTAMAAKFTGMDLDFNQVALVSAAEGVAFKAG